MIFLNWLLSILLAFGLGTGVGANYADDPANAELKEKVEAHMDVIVDEAASIVDDVAAAADQKWEDVKNSDEAQKVQQFKDDVDEIVSNTLNDIEEHFGPEDAESIAEEAASAAEEAVEEVESAVEEAAEDAGEAA